MRVEDKDPAMDVHEKYNHVPVSAQGDIEGTAGHGIHKLLVNGISFRKQPLEIECFTLAVDYCRRTSCQVWAQSLLEDFLHDEGALLTHS